MAAGPRQTAGSFVDRRLLGMTLVVAIQGHGVLVLLVRYCECEGVHRDTVRHGQQISVPHLTLRVLGVDLLL